MSGHPVWSLRVRWARQSLVSKGYLYREPKGVWRITPEGQAYLEQNWSSWQPRYSGDEAHDARDDRPPRPLRRRTGGTAQQQGDREPAGAVSPERRHERLKSILAEIGDVLTNS